jgi:putative transposase
LLRHGLDERHLASLDAAVNRRWFEQPAGRNSEAYCSGLTRITAGMLLAVGAPRYHAAMPNYRRRFEPGGCWFFTVNLHDRRSNLLTENISALRDSTRRVLRRHPFRIEAFVVLPDHLHAIWTLPPGDSDFPTRWRLIKTHFSRAIPHGETLTPTRAERGERGVWQRRYWEHLVRSEFELGKYIEYCAINPVKHGLVRRAADWPYSSFHRDVRKGIFSENWGVDIDIGGEFGEREA